MIHTRRQFLLTSITSLLVPQSLFAGQNPKLSFGMLTDAHYCEAEARGTRYYRESIKKMRECISEMNQQKVDFVVELGDMKDQDSPPVESQTIKYLQAIEAEFQKFDGSRYHALGNHDMDSISKKQFLTNIDNTGIAQDKSYYSFDKGGLHCIVLDANFTSKGVPYDHGNFDWTDANIPQQEQDWLQNDLSNTNKPVIVFLHQLLDGEGSVFIKNAVQVRKILEASNKVIAVFQGHHHAGQYNHINKIHYVTLKAIIEGAGEENNAFVIANFEQDRIVIKGYRKAVSRKLELNS